MGLPQYVGLSLAFYLMLLESLVNADAPLVRRQDCVRLFVLS